MANQIGGSIVWNLDVDDSKFQAGLNKAKAQAGELGKDVEREFSNIQSKVTNSFDKATAASQVFAGALLGVGAAAITAGGFGVKYAAEVETLTQGFVTLLGDARKASDAIKMIQKDAAQTPFAFKGLVEANLLLTSVTKNAPQSEKLLLNIGRALTAAGKSGTELDRVIINLQQIANVGKITELDIRQFGFAGINILELLADYYGTTKEAASDMVKNSKNAFVDLQGAFAKAGENGGRFSKAFTDQAGTMNQVWSNFQDNLGITASKIVTQTGLFDGLKNALKGVTNILSYFASDKGMAAIMHFLDTMKANLPIVIGLIVGGLTPAFKTSLLPAILKVVASFKALLPFLGWGALVGAAIVLLIQALGGWDGVVDKFKKGVDFIKGKLAQLEPAFTFVRDRIGQILKGFGISGEFGGLREVFAGLAEGAMFYTERTLQILGEYWKKAKNFLAFGGTEGNATFIDALVGIWNRLKPLLDTLQPVFDKIKANFELTGQIIQTQVKPAFDDLIRVMGPLIEALKPILKEELKKALIGMAVAIGFIIATVLAIITGLVAGLANALPYIFQAFEGLIQFIRGVVQIITGLLTGDLGLAWEGMKQAAKGAFDFFYNGFMAIEKFVRGFVEAVVTFFVGLYNTLVGNSIIPDMVNAIVAWFMQLPGRIYNGIIAIVTQVPQVFKDAWASVTSIVSGWVSDVYNWGVNIARSFADGFSQLGQWLKDKINSALNSAKSFLQGKSPPIAGPFKEIDKWGFNVGSAWVKGLEQAISTVSLENPFDAGSNIPAPAFSPAVGGQGKAGIGNLVNIEKMEVRDDSDIREVSRELGFIVENSSGFTNQNG